MKPSEAHKPFFDKRPYNLGVHNEEIFSSENVNFLKRFGSWMEALDEGAIQPETDGQRSFVQVCRGQKEPTTNQELLWWKLKERRKFEQDDWVDPSLNRENISRAVENSSNQRDGWWSSSERS